MKPMKNYRILLIPCVTLLATFAVFHFSSADGESPRPGEVLIRRTFQLGEKATYNFKESAMTTFDMSSAKAKNVTTEITNTSVCSLETVKVAPDGSSADVKLEVKDHKVSLNPEFPKPPRYLTEYSATAKITPRGEVSSIECRSKTSYHVDHVRALFRDLTGCLTFPEKPIRAGSSWQIVRNEESPTSPYGKETLDVRFVGEEKFQRWNALRLELKGKIQSALIAEGDTGASNPVRQDVDRSVSTTVLVDKATGQLLRLECKDVPQSMVVTRSSTKFPVTGTYSTEISIVK